MHLSTSEKPNTKQARINRRTFAIPNGLPMSTKRRFGGANNLAQFWRTKKSLTAKAKSAASRSSASRCANGCSASPPTPRNCWPTSTRLTGAIRSRKCSGTGLAAAKVRRWIFKVADVPVRANCTIQKIRVFTTRPDTLFGATYMVLSPEHKLVGEITTRGTKASRRRLQNICRRKSDLERTNWRRKKPACSPALTPSIPSTVRRFPSGLPTTFSPATALAQSWPCPRMTSAILSLRQKFNLPIVQVVQPQNPKTDWQGFVGRWNLVNSTEPGNFHHRTAHRRSQKENHRLAGRKRSRQENHQLQTARLAVQPSALLGRAVSDRLEKGRRRKSVSRSFAGNCVAAAAADAGRLQAHRRRPAAARPREGLGEPA